MSQYDLRGREDGGYLVLQEGGGPVLLELFMGAVEGGQLQVKGLTGAAPPHNDQVAIVCQLQQGREQARHLHSII